MSHFDVPQTLVFLALFGGGEFSLFQDSPFHCSFSCEKLLFGLLKLLS